MRRAGGRSGAWVMDADGGKVLFAMGSGRSLQLASNTKLFTTATALAASGPTTDSRPRSGPPTRSTTGSSARGCSCGARPIRRSAPATSNLAQRVAAAGVETVKGSLRYDDSFLDRRDRIPQHGINPDPLGTLSALTLDGGGARAPERSVAKRLGDALRRAGVGIGRKIKRGIVPKAESGASEVAEVSSPPISTSRGSRTCPPTTSWPRCC